MVALAADELKWVTPLVLSAFMADHLCTPHAQQHLQPAVNVKLLADFAGEETKFLGVTALSALQLFVETFPTETEVGSSEN
jgi:hypothetical protein